jgi:hypothetical protein
VTSQDKKLMLLNKQEFILQKKINIREVIHYMKKLSMLMAYSGFTYIGDTTMDHYKEEILI